MLTKIRTEVKAKQKTQIVNRILMQTNPKSILEFHLLIQPDPPEWSLYLFLSESQ